MDPDPIIEEVRRIRGEMAEDFDCDLEALFRHGLEYQKRWADRLVTHPVADEPDDAMEQRSAA